MSSILRIKCVPKYYINVTISKWRRLMTVLGIFYIFYNINNKYKLTDILTLFSQRIYLFTLSIGPMWMCLFLVVLSQSWWSSGKKNLYLLCNFVVTYLLCGCLATSTWKPCHHEVSAVVCSLHHPGCCWMVIQFLALLHYFPRK